MALLSTISITIFLVVWVIRLSIIFLGLKVQVGKSATNALLMSFMMMLMLMIALPLVQVTTPPYLDALLIMVLYLGI